MQRDSEGRREESARGPTAGRGTALLLLLVAVGALWQALLIWTPRADLRLGGTAQVPVTYHAEEIESGTLALDLLEGRVLGVLDYQHAPYFGGSVAMGVLAVPFFAAFGPSVQSLKLTMVLVKAIGVVFLFVLLGRWGGRRAAWIGTLAFVFAAPGYARLSIITWGTHFESNTFALVIVWFYALAYAEGRERPSLAALAAAGVVAGFATYFCYVVLILIGTLAALRLALRGRRRLGPESAAVLAGYVVGLWPWLVYSLRHDFPGRGALAHALGEGKLPETLAERLRRVAALVEQYPRSFFFADLPPAWARVVEAAFALTFALAFATAGAAGLRALRRRAGAGRAPRPIPLALVCAAYPVCFVLAYALNSGFTIGRGGDSPEFLRYLYVLYPFGCIALGLGAERVLEKHGQPFARLLAGWVVALCALAVVGHAQLLDLENRGVNARIDGYSRHSFGRFLVATYPHEPELVLAALERSRELRDPDQLDALYQGAATFLANVTSMPAEALSGRLAADRPHYEHLIERLREQGPGELVAYIEAGWRRAERRAERRAAERESAE